MKHPKHPNGACGRSFGVERSVYRGFYPLLPCRILSSLQSTPFRGLCVVEPLFQLCRGSLRSGLWLSQFYSSVAVAFEVARPPLEIVWNHWALAFCGRDLRLPADLFSVAASIFDFLSRSLPKLLKTSAVPTLWLLPLGNQL